MDATFAPGGPKMRTRTLLLLAAWLAMGIPTGAAAPVGCTDAMDDASCHQGVALPDAGSVPDATLPVPFSDISPDGIVGATGFKVGSPAVPDLPAVPTPPCIRLCGPPPSAPMSSASACSYANSATGLTQVSQKFLYGPGGWHDSDDHGFTGNNVNAWICRTGVKHDEGDGLDYYYYFWRFGDILNGGSHSVSYTAPCCHRYANDVWVAAGTGTFVDWTPESGKSCDGSGDKINMGLSYLGATMSWTYSVNDACVEAFRITAADAHWKAELTSPHKTWSGPFGFVQKVLVSPGSPVTVKWKSCDQFRHDNAAWHTHTYCDQDFISATVYQP